MTKMNGKEMIVLNELEMIQLNRWIMIIWQLKEHKRVILKKK